MPWPWSGSIARRIQWGYYVLIAIIAAGFVVTAVFWTQVETQVQSLEAVSQLLDTVLEVRRYEKNWILYKDQVDYSKNQQQLAASFILLERRDQEFSLVAKAQQSSDTGAEGLRHVLTLYGDLMAQEFKGYQADRQHRLLDPIREQGKQMVEIAEGMSLAVHHSIAHTLKLAKASAFLFLLGSFAAALLLGKQLSRFAVSPLKKIVACTRKIAAGEQLMPEKLEDDMDLVEVKAVFDALQSMMVQLKQREQLVVKSEKLAAVGTLVAGVAHELNNPLSNAGTSAQILLEELRESDQVPRQFQLEMLEQITGETDRARGIVRSLLEFAREKQVNVAEVRLSDLIYPTIDLVRGQIPSQVEIKVSIGEDGAFWGDRQRLQQVLVNLLLNAFQALADTPGVVSLRGNTDLSTKKVIFEVEDNGPGIPVEVRKRIFDPFFTTKDVGHGSGLGLAITREIILKHGGEVVVDSTPGVGTRFIVTIPMASQESGVQGGAGL
jgi:signal transduction histidine kinase